MVVVVVVVVEKRSLVVSRGGLTAGEGGRSTRRCAFACGGRDVRLMRLQAVCWALEAAWAWGARVWWWWWWWW